MPTLTDGVVSLRPSDIRDLEGIDAGLRDPEVVHWLGQSTSSAADVLELNERRWSEGAPTLSICDRDGAFAGLVSVNAASRDTQSARSATRCFRATGAKGSQPAPSG
jgi:hypothetical protein